MEMLMT